MVFDVVPPIDAPQIAAPKRPPPKPPRLDWIDERIIEVVHDYEPLKLWQALNLAADGLSPGSRGEGRELRLKLWGKIRRLIGLRLVFRVGKNSVATVKPTLKPPGGRVRRPKRTVVRAASEQAVSAVKSASPPEPGSTPFAVRAEVFVTDHSGQETPPTGPETECAPGPAEVSLAAKSLASLPRRPKRRWSGWINDRVRCYRTMPVQLSGERVYVFGARRGLLVYVTGTGMCVGDPDEAGRSWGVVPVKAVEVVRNPHAVLLGQMKAGIIERRSALKAASARANGRLPPGPGRRRGRPPHRQVPYLPVSPPTGVSGQPERREPWQPRSAA